MLFKKIFSITLIAVTFSAEARMSERGREQSRQIGSGIVYPGQNESAYVNPIGFAESGKTSLLAKWLFDPNAPLVSIESNFGTAGVGATYIHAYDTNYIYGGFGVNLGPAIFGVSLLSVDGNDLDGDASLAFDFDSFRVTGVVRSISGGINRVDVGIGAKLGQANLEFDVKKPRPFDSDIYLFDTGISVAVEQFSFGFGVDFAHARNSTSDAHIHAGVDYRFTQNLAAQVNYRPSPQELLASTKWAAGLRYTF